MKKEAIRELAEKIQVMDHFNPLMFKNPKAPAVSIYLPMHRSERELRRDEWDRLEFKNLAKEAERTLAEQYQNPRDYSGVKEYLDFLLEHEDLPLWLDAGASLGFLITNESAHAFNLGFEVESVVVVSDHFYVKPILRNSQYGMTYKLLLLDTDFFSLLEGDRSAVHYIPLPSDIKNYFAETYPEFDGETTILDYYSMEDHESPFHNHKSRNDVTQEEAEKFFRYVDKAMNETLVKNDPTPVILVCLPEHVNMFRKIATFKTLLPKGIEKDPGTLSGTDLKNAAVKIMDAESDAKLAELEDKFNYHISKGNASDDIMQIGMALAEKKVGVLFVEAGKGVPGTFNETTGEVNLDFNTNPANDKQIDPASPDIANAFAQAAIAQGALLFVLEHDKMPTENGMAAIYRY